MDNLDVKIGGLYRHISGRYYRVECIAKHIHSEETLVIYRSMLNYEVLAIPIEIFCNKVDHNKYPAIKQCYVFEYMSM